MKKILQLLHIILITICVIWFFVALNNQEKLAWFPLVLVVILAFGLGGLSAID